MATLVTSSGPARATASWWRSPQRVLLRRIIFQIHLWAGVVLALYAIVIGLSGAALVFKARIDAHELRGYKLSTATPGMTLTKTLRQLGDEHPGWRVTGLRLEDRAGAPVTAMMYRIGAVPDGNYRLVIFDPGNGHVFADRMRFDGALGWLANLHFNLLMGRRGLLISGWMAVGLLLLCLSGIVVWWPGVARWIGALILRLHRHHHRRDLNWKRLNWDLHSVIGFWSCAALIVVTVTGLYFVFPAPIRNLTVLATGGSIAQAKIEEAAPARRPARTEMPLLDVDQALAAARHQLPADAPPGYVAIPAKSGSPWYVTGYYRDALPYSRLVSITLDPRTGDLLRSNDTTRQMLGLQVIQHIFTVHFGSFGGDGLFGTIVQVSWVLLGISPAVLAITGLIMFWNRKLHPWLRKNR